MIYLKEMTSEARPKETNILSTENSRSVYYPEFFETDEADNLFELCKELDLEKNPPVVIFGKPGIMHRSIGFFSNESEGYKYTNQISKSKPLPKFLSKLLKRVNKHFNSDFNGILVNRYENGCDNIGPHSDDEKGLGTRAEGGSIVVGISLGAERIMRFRGKKTVLVPLLNDGKKYKDQILEHGSVFTMEGNFQKEFTHEIPVQKKVDGMRISLTFRKHVV